MKVEQLLGRMAAAVLLLTRVVNAEAKQPHEGLPESFVGTWVVEAVRPDTTSTRRTYYNYNDKRLLRATLHISLRKAEGKMPERLVCIGPVVKADSTTMDELIEKSMSKQDEDVQIEAVKRYELPVDGKKRVSVFWIRCKEGDFGPDSPPGPAGWNWVVEISERILAIRWYDNTILLLKPRRKSGPVCWEGS